jgi:anionic cell wall polymer biosynthesis LytR-Cps2A-Psr (LCP) family protein
MSGRSVEDFYRRQAREARGSDAERSATRRTKRSKILRRIALVSVSSLVVLVSTVAGGGYLVVNHLASNVQRLPGIAALHAPDQPVMPAATRTSMTVLLTSSGKRPKQIGGTGLLGSSTKPQALSGLISLVHLNANGQGGAVVNIPPNAVVYVPGHGRMMLWSTLPLGGPSLLIETVERLTNVRITHYSVFDLRGAVGIIRAVKGVSVHVPYAFTSEGFTFRAGINHLTAATFLPYERQPGVSEVDRMELQQNLLRAMLLKIAHLHLLEHVGTDYKLLWAITGALSVDTDFSNSQLEDFTLRLSHLPSSAGTFITAPTSGATGAGTGPVYLYRSITDALWQAIRHDAVAAFARRYPSTRTPGAPG